MRRRGPWWVVALVTLAVAGCSERSASPPGDGDPPEGAAPESTEAAGEAPPGAAGQWVAVLSAEGGFSVELPGEPVREERTIPSEFGPRPAVFLSAEAGGGTSYNLAYTDYPEAVLEVDPGVVLESAVQGATADVPGTVESSTRLAVDGYPAVDYVISVPGGTLQARALLAGTRLYVLQRAGAALDPGGFRRFVDSFEVSALDPQRS